MGGQHVHPFVNALQVNGSASLSFKILLEGEEVLRGGVVEDQHRVGLTHHHHLGRVLGDALEGSLQATAVEAGDRPVQKDFPVAVYLVGDAVVFILDGTLEGALDDLQHRELLALRVLLSQVDHHSELHEDARDDAPEQVMHQGRDHGGREDQHLLFADLPGVFPHGRFTELPAHQAHDGCQAGKRQAVDHVVEEDTVSNQEHSVPEIAPLRPASGHDVGRRFDASGDDREAADRRRSDVGGAHGEQGGIGFRPSPVGILFVDRRDRGE